MLSKAAGMHMNRYEVKGMPTENLVTKITEAYGIDKYSKLLKQISGDDLDVRINALTVLCDEFHNGLSIDGYAREDVINILTKMITDPDYITRVKVTEALSLASNDAIGSRAIIEYGDEYIPMILQGANDPSEVVRGSIYITLVNLTKTMEGLELCVSFNITKSFVIALGKEIDSLLPILLKGIHNIVRNEIGLHQILNNHGLNICIELINKSITNLEFGNEEPYSEYEAEILSESAKTLGFVCFDGKAKQQAIELNIIKRIIDLFLLIKKINHHKVNMIIPSHTKASLTIILMALTSANEGKIQISKIEFGIDAIIIGLYDDNRVIILNTLKIISNISVFPPNRAIINLDSTCIVKLRKLSKSDDLFIAKHATIALNAASWNP